jgi:O-antigen biosynthesis protein
MSELATVPRRNRISGCIICYNRASIVETCLRSLRFVDELIVVDKSSTDGTREIAERYADRLVTVPWTPTVEETRAEAIALCSHEWIVSLDDDECLSPDAIRFIIAEMTRPGADIYSIPVRHYVIGRHDERAYYWPEYHHRLFRRGALEFTATVHGGISSRSSNIRVIVPETGVCIHHLSHVDVNEWIEKTNRYTSRPDRASTFDPAVPLSRDFALERITFWLGKQSQCDDNYLTAVALLRGIYDIVDRLKRWERESGQNGAEAFNRICATLQREYDEIDRSLALHTQR